MSFEHIVIMSLGMIIGLLFMIQKNTTDLLLNSTAVFMTYSSNFWKRS